MDSSFLFKFTNGEVEAKNIIRIMEQNLVMAYLKITSMGSLDIRVEGKEDSLLGISSAIMQRSV